MSALLRVEGLTVALRVDGELRPVVRGNSFEIA